MICSVLPWESDRELDLELVQRAARARLGDTLAVEQVELIGHGWDNDAYLIDSQWVLRFPRRADVVPRMRRERRALPVVSAALEGFEIPCFALWAEPGEGDDFPYPIAGYPYVEGPCADEVLLAPEDLPGLARSLGRALSRLHAIDPTGLDLPAEQDTPSTWRARLIDAHGELVELLGAEVASRWAQRWRIDDLPAAYDGPPRYLHNDLAAEHLILDPSTHALRGIIDFTDQAVGDPLLDLIGLYTWLGEGFVREVVAHHDGLEMRDRDWRRLRYLVSVYATMWLLDAHSQGEDMETWINWFEGKILRMLGDQGCAV